MNLTKSVNQSKRVLFVIFVSIICIMFQSNCLAKASNIVVEANKSTVSLTQGDSTVISIRITNQENITLNGEVLIANIKSPYAPHGEFNGASSKPIVLLTNESTNVSLKITTDWSTKPGEYNLPIYLRNNTGDSKKVLTISIIVNQCVVPIIIGIVIVIMVIVIVALVIMIRRKKSHEK
ncbi:MAG: hypothetical protein QMC80_07925 [Thermoplasmatales archaeon]|nr:hypothetical protein [Thermoplasmatales archaeon]